MSSSTQDQSSIPSSDFKPIFDAALSYALSEYKKKTGKELLDHPLATEVQRCDTVDAILAIFRGQAEAFQQFRAGDQRLMKWISPIVDVLHMFSGTLGGVAGLAFPPAGVIFTGIGVLLAAAKDVRASHDALVELFERIESFFKRLGVYTQISLTTEMAEVFVKIVAEVLSILSIATKEVKRKRARIYFRKLLGRTDIQDALRSLDSLIQEEVRMTLAQTLKTTIEHKDDSKKANVAIANNLDEIVDNTDEIVNNTDKIADSIYKMKWNQIEQDVRKWFSPPDPSTNHNTACEVYHNVPPTWFFGAGVFEDWMLNGSLLWVHGKPGSGKSVLCSAIIQRIMTLRDAGRAMLAYFYFDFRDDEKQNLRNFVTSLLVQLSAYSNPCCGIIYRLYLAHGKGTQQPSNGVLINRLKEMLTVATQHPIFIVMDALDECPDYGMPTPREEVLKLVKDFVRLRLPNLHICVTSRPEIDIITKLKPLAVNAISLHEESRQNIVIANYVSSVVSSDERMRNWRDEDKKLVVEELSERADGMFQWVFCQLEMLRHAVQPDVRAILEKLPKTLDETYERVLKDINENNREHARRLLHFLSVAVRPLRVEELAEILTFDFDTAEGGIPKFHADQRPKDQEVAVLSICSSLVSIVDNRGSRVVQFSHLSVKEFLTSNHLATVTGHLTLYHILPGPAHTIITQVCLGLLLHLDDRHDNESVKSSPLAEYAARHWIAHAQFKDVTSPIEDGIKSLFDLDKPHFAAWIGLYDIDAESGRMLPSETPNPLYYSALCGFHDLVRHIAIKHPQHVNAIGGTYGFPLVAALCRNHFSVAELLLEHGGSVDVRDAKKQTVLHKTIDQHDNVVIDAVRFLLEHGADVNAWRDDLWTPLHLALNNGDLSVARMLLEHHADVNSQNNDGQAPLHLLSRRETSQNEDDSSSMAKLLLERGANVNEKDKDNETPLHLASFNKRSKIIRVLLNHGANTDAENYQGETPLQIVLRGNHNAQGDSDGVGVTRLLMEHGAEAYARDKYHISTSDLACCFGKEKIWQVLLGNGEILKSENSRDQTTFRLWIEESDMDRNIQNKYDTILLHSASYHGRPEMARILLNHGVNMNARNPRGETALHVVSRGRYNPPDARPDGVDIVRLLLERGVDVNAQDKDQGTPLHSASYSGKLEIARILLYHGANANAKNNQEETPLHRVSQGEYESQADGVRVAQLLLGHGVDVNAQDKNHVTPLHLASWYGKLEITRLLLEYAALKGDRVRTLSHLSLEGRAIGSDVQQKDLETPLHFACFRGKPEIARLLLDYGANANSTNHQGETPMHLVSRGEYDSPNGGVRVAELLLERGIDVNAADKDRWTPLHSACYHVKPEIARVLLYHDAKVNVKNDLGETPMHLVRQGNYATGSQDAVHVAQLLLDGGADVNARDKRDWTPLHTASYYGRPEIAHVLLDRGAMAKAEDDQGKTPLHRASQGNFECQDDGVRIAQLLLDHGVDVNAQDKNRVTPLHSASWCGGKLEVVRVLLGYDAVKNDWSKTPSHAGQEGSSGCVDVDAFAVNHSTPLHSACFCGGLETTRLLLDHGADVNAGTDHGATPLHAVACSKYVTPEDGVRIAQLLLERGGDVDAQREDNCTPLHLASYNGKLEIARLLLDHGAKANAKTANGETPLHRASCGKYKFQEVGVHVVQLLLGCGVDVNARRKDHWTPLHFASYYGELEIARVLLDHGSYVNAETANGETPLHTVSCYEFKSQDDGASVRVAQLLLERGIDVNKRRKDHWTPLHVASYYGKFGIARVLLYGGAYANAETANGETPLHIVACGKYTSKDGVRVAQLLLGRGVNVNVRCRDDWTPLHVASYYGKLEIVRVLVDHGAYATAETANGENPLHKVSCGEYRPQDGVRVAQLLLGRGVDVNAQRKDHWTPLHVASYYGKLEIARVLLNHGAYGNAKTLSGETPLHKVPCGEYESKGDGVLIAQLLLGHGVDVNVPRQDHWTPLHVASYFGKLEIARVLLDHGAYANAKTPDGETPLHKVPSGIYDSQEDGVRVARLLLGRGADMNAQRKDHWTPLHVASYYGKLEIVRVLLDRGAYANAGTSNEETPLHRAPFGEYESQEGDVRVSQLLLGRGVAVNAQRKDHWTPLHVASYYGKLEIVQVLLDHGAYANAKTPNGETPLHKVPCGEYESQEDGVRVAQLLLGRGVDVNARSEDHWTPLHVASYYGKLEIVRVLLDHNAEANAKTRNGETPLHKVSRCDSKSQEDDARVAQLLLERSADINAKCGDHQTPLHIASYLGKLEIVRVLLGHGAKVDAVDDRGETPLHHVSQGQYGSEEAGVGIARLLLDHGSDVNAKARLGGTPLTLLSRRRRPKLAELLLKHAASVNAQKPRAGSSRADYFKWKFLQ